MPTPEQVRAAIELVRKTPANYEYFFAKLDDVSWVAPLRSEGFFRNPPKEVEDNNSFGFPFWPESRYLVRMASQEPEVVFSVLIAIPDTDNVRVHEDILEAAASMPGTLAERLASREMTWLESQEHLYSNLPEYLGNLAAELARKDMLGASERLFRFLLRVKPTPNDLDEPKAYFSDWEYVRVVRNQLSAFIDRSSARATSLLIEALSKTRIASSEFSFVSRPAIEDNDQNQHRDDIQDALIEALRESASLSIAASPTSSHSLVDELIGSGSQLLHRVGIYLLTSHNDILPTSAIAETMNRVSFDDRGLRHEYFGLLSKTFPRLSDAQKELIADWIEEESENFDSDEPSERASMMHWRQARRLACLRDILPASWTQRFAEAVKLIPQLEHPDFLVYSTSTVGPTSPLADDDLKKLTVEEIVAFLSDWEPPNGLHPPSREGLSRALQAAVTADPERFAVAATAFIGVHPTFARGLVMGFRDALTTNLDWRELLTFALWVSHLPPPPEQAIESDADEDPHWGWCRQALASLLASVFKRNFLPPPLAQSAWDVLSPLTDDPDPSAAAEADSDMDPATRAINSTRGEALRAAVEFALWEYRNSAKSEPSKAPFSLDGLSSVRGVLDRHLNSHVDSSAAIRSVYGQYFPWLALLDRDWAKSKREAIFPNRDKDSRLHAAAWNTYIVFCGAYDDMYDLLRDQYEEAVSYAGDDPVGRHDLADPRARLGEHLMTFLGRGLIAATDPKSILMRFLGLAPKNIVAHTIEYCGRLLGNRPGDVPPAVLERYKAFWDVYAPTLNANPIKHVDALEAFGWWFSSGRFDPGWSGTIVLNVLRTTGSIDDEYGVVANLVKLFRTHPNLSLEILTTLIEKDRKGWGIFSWKADSRELLKAALDDSSTRDTALALIHQIGSLGHHGFRDLLESSSDN